MVALTSGCSLMVNQETMCHALLHQYANDCVPYLIRRLYSHEKQTVLTVMDKPSNRHEKLPSDVEKLPSDVHEHAIFQFCLLNTKDKMPADENETDDEDEDEDKDSGISDKKKKKKDKKKKKKATEGGKKKPKQFEYVKPTKKRLRKFCSATFQTARKYKKEGKPLPTYPELGRNGNFNVL
ncbi:DNA topoisomerase 1-like [Clytia hemisphaerica]|uniref:DNA topoisomerase 1-like n=1 Tax=Clytia hemisphaerica TaxID=252671 RepID=UPI0034D77CDE